MDPAAFCWSAVFQRCSEEDPSYLVKALSFYSVPSWSFYLVTKVTARSQFITIYVLISDWTRPLSLDRETPSIMLLAHAILAFFSCPSILVCSGTSQSRKGALAIGVGRIPRLETLQTMFETEHKCWFPRKDFSLMIICPCAERLYRNQDWDETFKCIRKDRVYIVWSLTLSKGF